MVFREKQGVIFVKDYTRCRDLICLCLIVLTFFVFGLWGEIETVDKPVETVSTVSVAPTPIPTSTPEPAKPPYLRDDVPLSAEIQTVLYEACQEAGIEYEVGLGLIEAESVFNSDAVSPFGCYGLCQLNPQYFPADLSDEDNIKAGIGYLGELVEKYGDLDAALTAYNAGSDTGSRTYARKVMNYANEWGGKIDG